MSITTLRYLLFIGGGMIIYYILPKKLQWLWLLLLSGVFYLYGGTQAVGYIIFTALTTWGGAVVIEKITAYEKEVAKAKKAAKKRAKETAKLAASTTEGSADGSDNADGKNSSIDENSTKATTVTTVTDAPTYQEPPQPSWMKYIHKRVIFWTVLVVNVGILVFIKGLLFSQTMYPDTIAGLPVLSSFIVPLAVSFYTLQAMSYLIDVYWGRQIAEKNPVKLLLYLSFFPQMVQGPIARYGSLGKQLFEPHRFDIDEFEQAALTVIWGMFKKLVIANRLAPLVAELFDNYDAHAGSTLLLGAFLYAIFQYADFSGGIDIVTGVARLYGIKLAPNFKNPYFSSSLGEFWRRWHISLGTWMKDYVFYPFVFLKSTNKLSAKAKKVLGNQLGGALPMVLGNLIVFFLVGAWHGFYMHFIVWGLYNGVIVAFSAAVEPQYAAIRKKLGVTTSTPWYKNICIIRTFLIVVIGGFFDRANSFMDSLYIIKKVLLSPLTLGKSFYAVAQQEILDFGITRWDVIAIIMSVGILWLVELYQERTGKQFQVHLFEMKLPIRWAILYAFFFFAILTHVDNVAFGEFLYAQF